MNLTLRYLLLLVTAIDCMSMVPPVEEYFPELKGDLTRLEWAHAVNSQSLLKSALEDNTIMMLEADVVLGQLDGEGDLIPIMGHPPATNSDLTLQNFVNDVIDFQLKGKKGIKLDFKSNEAFNESCKILEGLRPKFTFPVWLNADILPGPLNASAVPLDAASFLGLSHQLLPEAVLSVGWTTAFAPNAAYTDEQTAAMLSAIEAAKVTQPVTLAVRAAFAALSSDKLIDLVSNIDRYQESNHTTLTIWMSSSSDIVNTQLLRGLIFQMGKQRVALDVPEKIRDELNLGNSGSPVSVAQGALAAVLSSVTSTFNKVVNIFHYLLGFFLQLPSQLTIQEIRVVSQLEAGILDKQ